MIFFNRKGRENPTVSSGSMADIAFLLLIFFLVTTTIDIDKGIQVRLPQWSEPDAAPPFKHKKRNLFSVKLNMNDELLVRGERLQVTQLRAKTKEFVANPMQSSNLAERPQQALISLQNDRGSSYEAYILVYNELKAAYNELWEAEAKLKYGYGYKDLSEDKQKEVRKAYPMIISEAEPTDFADNSL